MTEEPPVKAAMLRGYWFGKHPQSPTLGVLRLDEQDGQHFVLVTKSSLRQLGEACLKHAEDIEETN